MSRKIIGVTVGTTLKPEKIEKRIRPVKTVNGVAPDDDGNVQIEVVDEQKVTNIVLGIEEFKKMQEDIADLKFVPIEITSMTPNTAVELGQSIGTWKVSWTLNKEPSVQYMNGTAIDTSLREMTFNGPFTTSQMYELQVRDDRMNMDARTSSLKFYNGVYYGVMEDGAEVDSAAILALTKGLIGSRTLQFTVDAGATQKIVYALPTRYGTPNFNVGGFDGGFTLAKTFDITNASGYTESYDVWMSDNVGLGSNHVKVS